MDIRIHRDSGESQAKTDNALTNDPSAANEAYGTRPESPPVILLAGCEEDPVESHIVRGID